MCMHGWEFPAGVYSAHNIILLLLKLFTEQKVCHYHVHLCIEVYLNLRSNGYSNRWMIWFEIFINSPW